MNRNPYDALGSMDWSKIDRWEMLDFVKALPDEVKAKLRKLPKNAEVEYEYCERNQKMMPRMNPENCRTFWLRYYNERYEPIRAKNAQLAEKHAMMELAKGAVTFFKNTEAVLARMSEQLERIKQRLAAIDLRLQEQNANEYESEVPWLPDD